MQSSSPFEGLVLCSLLPLTVAINFGLAKVIKEAEALIPSSEFALQHVR